MNTSKTFFLLVILLIQNLSFELVAANNDRKECEQWQVVDIPFVVKKASENPFDVQFSAVFNHSDGAQMTIHGFYNGTKEWVLRFSSAKTGVWTYLTSSSLKELSGKTGTISVTKNTKRDRHGMITVSQDDARKFSYEDGAPYFLLAFELDWLFALDADNKEGNPKTEQLINTIKDYGFNQIVMNVYAYDVSWGKDEHLQPEHEYGSPNIFPFGGTNQHPDFSVLNTDFFKHLDQVIALLNEKEIVSHLMIYVWNKMVNWPDMYAKEDNMYFDYVIKRYQAYPNIIWDISKEALTYGRCDDAYVLERIDRVRRLDSYQRLVTVHDYGFCANYPMEVDFISAQKWSTDIYSEMLKVYTTFTDKPTFNIEHGGYETSPYQVFMGDYNDPVKCLERNYECVFAGTYSTYYWQGTSWNVIIHNPYDLPKDQQPKFDYYRHLYAFFSEYDYSQLRPYTKSSSGHGLTDNYGTYLYYVPRDNYAFSAVIPKPESGNITCKWFNPLTGAYTEAHTRTWSAWMSFRSPWAGQIAILIIR